MATSAVMQVSAMGMRQAASVRPAAQKPAQLSCSRAMGSTRVLQPVFKQTKARNDLFVRAAIDPNEEIGETSGQALWRELTATEEARGDSKGLGKQGTVGQGGMWLSSTTRHVHIYAGALVNNELDQTQLDKLTIDVDPDNEFHWTDEPLQKVYRKFEECVAAHDGKPLNDYTLRLIGSDVEHYIRKMLQAGEIKYNLQCRAVNYSMGRPQVTELDSLAEAAEEEAADADTEKAEA